MLTANGPNKNTYRQVAMKQQEQALVSAILLGNRFQFTNIRQW